MSVESTQLKLGALFHHYPGVAGGEGARAGGVVGDPTDLGLLACGGFVGWKLLVSDILFDGAVGDDGQAGGWELFQALRVELSSYVVGGSTVLDECFGVGGEDD